MAFLSAVIDINEQLHILLQNSFSIFVWMLAASSLFFVGKVREAIYQTIQSRIRKTSRLRPATTAGHIEINKMLSRMLDDMKAFRVCIFQFHNGDSFMLSNHSWKVSCTHEILSDGAMPSFEENQSLPVSAISDWIGPIIDADAVVPGVRIRKRCEGCQVTCPMAKAGHRAVRFDTAQMAISVASAKAKGQGISHSLVVNLVDTSRKATFGFISLHYKDTSDEVVDAMEGDLCRVCEAADKIQFYLTTDFRGGRRRWLSVLTGVGA